MKLMLLLLAMTNPVFAEKMSHDQVVNAIKKNKVGKAPQKGKAGPHPQYEKLEKVLPKHKTRKHHRKKDYSKGANS